MVWVRLAQPAQQAPLKSHKTAFKTITFRGDIRGEIVLFKRITPYVRSAPMDTPIANNPPLVWDLRHPHSKTNSWTHRIYHWREIQNLKVTICERQKSSQIQKKQHFNTFDIDVTRNSSTGV
jgi:hypothetical protein